MTEERDDEMDVKPAAEETGESYSVVQVLSPAWRDEPWGPMKSYHSWQLEVVAKNSFGEAQMVLQSRVKPSEMPKAGSVIVCRNVGYRARALRAEIVSIDGVPVAPKALARKIRRTGSADGRPVGPTDPVLMLAAVVLAARTTESSDLDAVLAQVPRCIERVKALCAMLSGVRVESAADTGRNASSGASGEASGQARQEDNGDEIPF